MTATCKRCEVEYSATPRAIRRGRVYCSHQCYCLHKMEIRINTIPDGSKRCAVCRIVKPYSDFYTHGIARPDDKSREYASWCKRCRCEDERRRRADPTNVAKFHQKYERDMDFRGRELCRAISKRCRRNGWQFDLDPEWLAARLKSGRCELTGLPFDMSVVNRRPTAYSPSIDRIKAGGGYTKDNCRLVLHAANLLLMDYGFELVLDIAEAMVAYQRENSAKAS